jgi:Fe-S cluster assembly scaffold protein SufB
MEKIINKPIVETFGWLKVGGTKVTLPDRTISKTIVLPKGAAQTLYFEDDGALISLVAELSEEASLTVVLVRHANTAEKCFSDLQVNCKENARFHVIRVILGGQRSYDNFSVTLEGRGSSFQADIGYQLTGTEQYDVNCEAIHLGKRTESNIRSLGVLSQNAEKLLRGTIDFRTGCSGSVGGETEDVLLLDDTVVNKTVPTILCTEEDVSGNHGATIGRPDEQVLKYMASRGIEEDVAIKLMARAKLDAVIEKIPDEDLKQKIREENGWK